MLQQRQGQGARPAPLEAYHDTYHEFRRLPARLANNLWLLAMAWMNTAEQATLRALGAALAVVYFFLGLLNAALLSWSTAHPTEGGATHVSSKAAPAPVSAAGPKPVHRELMEPSIEAPPPHAFGEGYRGVEQEQRGTQMAAAQESEGYTGVGESSYAPAILPTHLSRPTETLIAGYATALAGHTGTERIPVPQAPTDVHALPERMRASFEKTAQRVTALRHKTTDLLRKGEAELPTTRQAEERPATGGPGPARPHPPHTAPLAPTHVPAPLEPAAGGMGGEAPELERVKVQEGEGVGETQVTPRAGLPATAPATPAGAGAAGRAPPSPRVIAQPLGRVEYPGYAAGSETVARREATKMERREEQAQPTSMTAPTGTMAAPAARPPTQEKVQPTPTHEKAQPAAGPLAAEPREEEGALHIGEKPEGKGAELPREAPIEGPQRERAAEVPAPTQVPAPTEGPKMPPPAPWTEIKEERIAVMEPGVQGAETAGVPYHAAPGAVAGKPAKKKRGRIRGPLHKIAKEVRKVLSEPLRTAPPQT